MAPSALLFDLDGTIWDSHPWYGDVLSPYVGAPGVVIEQKLKNGDNIAALIRHYGVPKSRFSNSQSKLRLFPGVEKTLAQLRQNSVLLGVVTNLPRWLVETMLDHTNLSRVFETVQPFIWPSRSKAERIFIALSSLNLNPNRETFYVGDLPSDCEAAMRAGISFAWARYGYGKESPPDGTTITLDSFEQVIVL